MGILPKIREYKRETEGEWFMRRKIAMMLAVMCLLVSMSTVSYAAEGESVASAEAAVSSGGTAVPYYINIANIAAGLRIEGNTAYCLAEVTAKKVSNVHVTMRLQKLEGGSWVTKVSWLLSSTTGIVNETRSTTLYQKGSYRVYLIATVGGEEVTCVSNTRTY